jgi:hypothetical protein
MATNTNTPKATPEAANSKKAQDVQSIYAANDCINGIYVQLHQMMESYGYPMGSRTELAAAFSAISTELGRAASFIINPSEEDIVDGVKERIRCGID